MLVIIVILCVAIIVITLANVLRAGLVHVYVLLVSSRNTHDTDFPCPPIFSPRPSTGACTFCPFPSPSWTYTLVPAGISRGKEETPAICATEPSKRKPRPVPREKAAGVASRRPASRFNRDTKGTRAFPLLGICEWVKLAVSWCARLG